MTLLQAAQALDEAAVAFEEFAPTRAAERQSVGTLSWVVLS